MREIKEIISGVVGEFHEKIRKYNGKICRFLSKLFPDFLSSNKQFS